MKVELVYNFSISTISTIKLLWHSCFIHPTYVNVAWHSLQHEAPDIDRIDDFVEYFNCTWINGQYRISQ